jgi:cysteine-rich repeat protein
VIVDLNRPKGIALLLASTCGNGEIEPPEACDDGNNVSGDGCAADCTLVAGVPAVSVGGMLLLVILLLAVSTATLISRRNA